MGSLVVSFFVRPLALQYYAVLNLAVSLAPCFLFSRIAEIMGYVQSEEKTQWVWSTWRKQTASRNVRE
jgi:uncharacterized membrane protein HdeD (DUF308 family)